MVRGPKHGDVLGLKSFGPMSPHRRLIVVMGRWLKEMAKVWGMGEVGKGQ